MSRKSKRNIRRPLPCPSAVVSRCHNRRPPHVRTTVAGLRFPCRPLTHCWNFKRLDLRLVSEMPWTVTVNRLHRMKHSIKEGGLPGFTYRLCSCMRQTVRSLEEVSQLIQLVKESSKTLHYINRLIGTPSTPVIFQKVLSTIKTNPFTATSNSFKWVTGEKAYLTLR